MTAVKEQTKKDDLRAYYKSSLKEFARYLNPHYMYGDIHDEVFDALQSHAESKEDDNFLVLIPRGHLKSHMLAVYVVWLITCKPWITIVYLSAGEDLATVQMYAIKNMLTSDRYRLLWPDMVRKEEGKRDKWATWAINVDHPARKKRGIRDFTLIIKTVKSNATGLHCEELLLDDLVVPGNAYTAAGRADVEMSVAEFVGILSPGGKTTAAGTRYDERDIYGQFESAEELVIDMDGNITGTKPQWKIFQREVEDQGDMMGRFLWPRVQSPTTGEWFGFNAQVLAKKKAKLISTNKLAHFYAQYYNDPHDAGSQRVEKDRFQYADPKHLERLGDKWYYNGKLLLLFAGMDLAWSDDTGQSNQKSDYSAIAVIGLDEDGYIYVLALDWFRTSKFLVYYNHIIKLQDDWGFKKIRIETNSAGKLICQEVEKYIRRNGDSLIIDQKVWGRQDGTKEERHEIILEPKYENKSVYHFKGGLTPELEDEITKQRPKFDDLKDALTIAISISRVPGKMKRDRYRNEYSNHNVIAASSRFGGRRAR